MLGTVRIFGAEHKISNHYQDNVFKSYQIGKKLAFNSGLFMGLIGLLTAGGISVVLWYGDEEVFIINKDKVLGFLLGMEQN